MRLRGLSVKAQTDQEHTITPLPSGARRLVKKKKQLELLIDLCESLPKTAKQGDGLHTRHYTGLHALILDRTGIDWDPGALSTAKKGLIQLNVLIIREDGDLEINYEAFEQIGLYSQRKEREKLPKAADAPAPKKAAPKALAESTAPVVAVTHEVVQPAKAPEREKEADALHANSEAKLRGQVHRAKELAKQVYREEAGLRAWEEATRLREEEKARLEEQEPAVEEQTSTASEEVEFESVAVRVRREREENPSLYMDWSERLQYEREQKRKAAEAAAAEPFLGGLFDHPEEEEEPEPADDSCDVDEELEWLLEPAGVSSDDDGEQW